MTETQEYLLNFIKYFDSFCRENKIEYFLAGGSMLGAVRHRGFLPWDDDIDVYMKTSEWKRAKKIFEECLPDRYVLCCTENDKEYGNPIVRITDTATTAYYKSKLADGTPRGVNLEIFLLDPITEDKKEQEQFYKRFWLYCECLSTTYCVVRSSLNRNKLSVSEYRKLQASIEKGDRQEILGKMEQELFSYNEESCDYYHERWGAYWLIYPKKAFNSQKYVPFEDTTLPVASGYCDVLFGEYGDNWMEVPDVKDQAVHLDIEDYDVPCRYYDEDLYADFDVDEYKKAFFERKKLDVELSFLRYGIKKDVFDKKNKIIDIEFNNEEIRSICQKAMEEGDYNTILDNMSKYYDMQREASSSFYLYDLDREIRYAAVYAKFMSGDLRFTERVRQNIGDTLDDKLANLFEDIDAIRKVRYSYFYENMEEHHEEARRLLNKYPKQLNLQEWDLLYRFKHGEDTTELLGAVRLLEEQYPHRYRLMKLEADILASQGDKASANIIYERILSKSNDGMVNNEIRDLGKK